MSADPPAEAPAATSRPMLVYDGDCAFCGYWARYWQQAHRRARGLSSLSGSRGAVSRRFRTPNSSGRRNISRPTDIARAARRRVSCTLSHARGKGIGSPSTGVCRVSRRVSECVYAFIAAHRPACLSREPDLCGARSTSRRNIELVAFLFTRLFGLIYLSAFVSFGVQALGLIGSHGILPLAECSTRSIAASAQTAFSKCRWCSG